jgi:hypothetical protein
MARTPRPNTVEEGAWDFQAHCPSCRAKVVIPITLASHVGIDNEGGKIRMKVTQQPQDHNCSQPAFPDPDDQPALSVVGTDEPDF